MNSATAILPEWSDDELRSKVGQVGKMYIERVSSSLPQEITPATAFFSSLLVSLPRDCAGSFFYRCSPVANIQVG